MHTTTNKTKNLLLLILIFCILLLVFPSSSISQQTEEAPTTDEYTSGEDEAYLGLKVHEVEVPVAPVSQIETLYSWSLRDTDIRDVMLTFARGGGFNIIVEPGVSGNVTVDLNKVKFEEVLEYLLQPLDLEYSQEGDFIRVFQPKLKTRIFTVDYVATQRNGTGALSVDSGKGSSGSTTGGGATARSRVSISSSTNVDFWGALIDALSTIVFGDEGSGASAKDFGGYSKEDKNGKRLIVNSQTGVVLITAIEKTLQEAAEFIKAIQTSAQRQVLIQAKIIEVTLSDDFEMGVNWSNIAEYPKMSGLLAGGSVFAGNLLPAAQSGVFQLGITDQNTSLLLDAMSSQGNVNVLSSPQVVTLNNQTALIKVTREETYFEITTTVDNDTGERTENVEAVTIDVGIVLSVTPQISADGMVMLNIHPSISELAGTATNPAGTVTKPKIDRRETDTMVKVNDGQTIVLAGLMKEKLTEELRMVPCLGEIPGLGMLFRHTDQSSEKIELVIMLTPLIMTADRIDIFRKYKQSDIKKLQKKLHLGTVPPLKGIKGEFNLK